MLLLGDRRSAIAGEVIPLELVTALLVTALVEDGRLLGFVESEVAAEPPESAVGSATSATVDMRTEYLDELELPRGMTPSTPTLWVKVVRVEVESDFRLPALFFSDVADTIEVLMEMCFTAGLAGYFPDEVVMGPLLEAAVLDPAMATT